MNTDLPEELAPSFAPQSLGALVDGLDLAYEHLLSKDQVPAVEQLQDSFVRPRREPHEGAEV